MKLTKDQFKKYDKLAKNATIRAKKCFAYTGALTNEDLKQIAWLGILSGLSQEKFTVHPNQDAYLFSFAIGYIKHAIHRKSRMVKVPWNELKQAQTGHAHLSYSWDNLPEAGYIEVHDDLNQNAKKIVSTFSSRDKSKILAGDFETLSKSGKQLLEVIKSQYSMEKIYA
jgi:hypothetical protein